MKKALRIALVVMVLALAMVWWGMRSGPDPAPPASTPGGSGATVPADQDFGRCDALTAAPPLPDTFTPASTDLAAIVSSLDTVLTEAHKAWLRCFASDEELLARTHHGLGRWLRNTLHLSRRPEIVAGLGARNQDEASSLIVLAYASHLRGRDLTPAEAAERRRAVLTEAGLAP